MRSETVNAVYGLSKDLAGRLKWVIKRLGPDVAAESSGKSGRMLDRYVKGEVDPPFQVVASLASAADVSLDWLATGKGSQQRKASGALLPPGELLEQLAKAQEYIRQQGNLPLSGGEHSVFAELQAIATDETVLEPFRANADMLLRLGFADEAAEIRSARRHHGYSTKRSEARLRVLEAATLEQVDIPSLFLPHLEHLVAEYMLTDADVQRLLSGLKLAFMQLQGEIVVPEKTKVDVSDPEMN